MGTSSTRGCPLHEKDKTKKNMKNKMLLLGALLLPLAMQAQTFTVSVKNPMKTDRKDVPVVVRLADAGLAADEVWRTQDATVKAGTTEVASQLDDLDKDGCYDELAFVADLQAKEEKTFTIELHATEQGHQYKARTFAEIVLRNQKIKEKNKHDIYLDEIFLTPETKQPFYVLHHHGLAMESELIALRFYFDNRQTPDLYGKFKAGLELHDTQFYPSKEQLAAGYGDDILWVGNTFGFGAFRGWNGKEPTMLSDVRSRGQRIIATGPVRTICDLVDRGWKPEGSSARFGATVRHTLWAGHRDIQVDVLFDRDLSAQAETRDLKFSTGMINVKDSKEIADDKGLRGLWGTDWPVAPKDSAGHKRETVGMGVFVPDAYRVEAVPANKDNYGYVLQPKGKSLTYYIAYTSDNESFGYHNLKDWANYLKQWRKELLAPAVVTINK